MSKPESRNEGENLDLNYEALASLRRRVQSQPKEEIVSTHSVSKKAVEEVSKLIGYDTNENYEVDPIFIFINSTQFAENVISLIKPDYENEEATDLARTLEDFLEDKYRRNVDKINASLIGMSVVLSAFHQDHGVDFIDGLKDLKEEEVIDTFSEYGDFKSNKTIIGRVFTESLPTPDNDELNDIIDNLRYDFQTFGLGEQVRDGADFAHFLVNRNWNSIWNNNKNKIDIN